MRAEEYVDQVERYVIALEGITDTTLRAYKQLAEHFCNTRLDGPPTPKKLADALKACAPEYRPAYWRKLRNALMYDQASKCYYDAADRLKATKNPVTTAKEPTKQKQRRVKSVKQPDLDKLVAEVRRTDDAGLIAALDIARILGCRPAEMLGIRHLQGQQVHITGVKKSKGVRGLDRTVELSEADCATVLEAVSVLNTVQSGKSGVIHKLQSRLDHVTKRLWPHRKARITLYSFRHQLGSDLKQSGMSRQQVAYIMGHQSTQSIEVYGDRRSGSSGRSIKPARSADLSLVRENHTAVPSQKQQPSIQPKTPALDRSGSSFQP